MTPGVKGRKYEQGRSGELGMWFKGRTYGTARCVEQRNQRKEVKWRLTLRFLPRPWGGVGGDAIYWWLLETNQYVSLLSACRLASASELSQFWQGSDFSQTQWGDACSSLGFVWSSLPKPLLFWKLLCCWLDILNNIKNKIKNSISICVSQASAEDFVGMILIDAS